MTEMKQRGIALPWDMDSVVGAPPADELNPPNAAALAQVADSLEEGSEPSWEESFGRSEEEVTTRVDVSGFLDAKRRSMDCHKTQRQDLGWMLDLPPDLADRVMATEGYVLRWLDGAEVPSSHRETALLPAR
jgi:LmbE family N-acetylglucosaminyl deacetylase